MTEHKSLASALAAVQADMPHVGKGQTADTGTYSYRYADLADCTAALLPKLAANGLAFAAVPTLTDTALFVLRYALKHGASGEEIAGDYPLPNPAQTTAQKIGSAITYARRYALCAVTGLAPDGDDDDAAAAAHDQPAVAPAPPDERVEVSNEIQRRGKAAGMAVQDLADAYAAANGGEFIRDASLEQLRGFLDSLPEPEPA